MQNGPSDLDVDSLLNGWDGEALLLRYDRPTGARILVAIHSSRLGPASGGTRMKPYADLALALADVLELSRAMTYKYAVANFPQGGAKAVIALPEDFDPRQRPELLRRYGTLIRELDGLYATGPDVGTSSADMDVVGETGAPYVRARTPAAGGTGDSSAPTALGVFCGMKTTIEYLDGDPSLRDKRVLVQGAGGVGGALIERLSDAGATVLFSDPSQVAIRRFRDQAGLEFIAPEQVFDVPCDVFSPCALGGVLDRDTIPRLRCRAVVGGANLQLAQAQDVELLAARGILYAPDFVVNVGGAMAVTGMESLGWTREQAEANVSRVGSTLLRVYEIARADGITTHAAALRIALRNLETAAAS